MRYLAHHHQITHSNMKKTTSIFLALSLALGSIGSAHADWNRHGGHRSHEHRPHHHRDNHGGPGWVGPAALLAITGLAIGAATYSHAAPSQIYSPPVYMLPPQPVQVMPESGYWHYCGSAGQYYPYVRHCPEGWQAVMPPR